MKKLIKIQNNNFQIDDFHSDSTCMECANTHTLKYERFECPITGNQCRAGHRRTDRFELFACSEESKTTENFKKEFNLIEEMIPYLPSLVKDLSKSVKNEYENRFQKFIHNISATNGRCIQVFESLGFNRLGKDVKSAIQKAKNIIVRNTKETAQSLFDIMKFENMIKVEMQVFELMYLEDEEKAQTMEKDYHNIRDIIMQTLHRFFYDFNQKDVNVNLAENYDKIYLNYALFSCSLFYIIENATKYVKPHSEVTINFFNDDDNKEYGIVISMQSHYLTKHEKEHIFDEGYSGEIAKKHNLNGHGIGMYRARFFLSKCGITINFDGGNNKEEYENIYYATNIITLRIPILVDKPIRKE